MSPEQIKSHYSPIQNRVEFKIYVGATERAVTNSENYLGKNERKTYVCPKQRENFSAFAPHCNNPKKNTASPFRFPMIMCDRTIINKLLNWTHYFPFISFDVFFVFIRFDVIC